MITELVNVAVASGDGWKIVVQRHSSIVDETVYDAVPSFFGPPLILFNGELQDRDSLEDIVIKMRETGIDAKSLSSNRLVKLAQVFQEILGVPKGAVAATIRIPLLASCRVTFEFAEPPEPPHIVDNTFVFDVEIHNDLFSQTAPFDPRVERHTVNLTNGSHTTRQISLKFIDGLRQR